MYHGKNYYNKKIFAILYVREIIKSQSALLQMGGGYREDMTEEEIKKLAIRKLMPIECWNLMGFSDEAFYKAKWKKETINIVGGKKQCNAKLMAVKGLQKHTDTVTYVYCTTKDLLDMETLIPIKQKKNGLEELKEKTLNVNIVIEKLEGQERLECVTNTTNNGDYTEMPYIVITNKEDKNNLIIDVENKQYQNTESLWKIQSEENCSKQKWCIILTLIKKITELKTYGCIKRKANIQGSITITTDLSKNMVEMKILFLKMENTLEQNSDSMLYKQAGNSIVVDCLYYILKNLLFDVEEPNTNTTIFDYL